MEDNTKPESIAVTSEPAGTYLLLFITPSCC